MKICLVVPWIASHDPTTVESRQGLFIYRQVTELNKLGHQFKIISFKWAGQSEYEKINDSIEVFRLPWIFIFRSIRYPIPNFRKLSRKILWICDDWKPDVVVFAHIIYLTSFPSLYLRKRIARPIIVTTDCLPGLNWSYGDMIVDKIGYIYSVTLGKLLLKRADGIQFLNNDLLRFAPEFNLGRDKIFTITTGVDVEKFNSSTKNNDHRHMFNFKPDDIIVLYVGRLDLVKGVKYLLEAVKTVIDQNDRVKLLIIGDGSLRSELEASVKQYPDNIIFAGYRDDTTEIMSMSDIFVLPSLSEGAPNVIMEASASGLPVIASRTGELPRQIIDGKTGFLVEPKDVNGLRDSINKLVNDTVLRTDMGNNGRKHMIDHYSWPIVCKKIEQEYTKVINDYYGHSS